MNSSPQSTIVDVVVVHDINMETLALAAAEKNKEEEAAEEAESTHPEIIVISDDESPSEEGMEISQPQMKQRRGSRPFWTISEDCRLINLIWDRRFQFIWKWIADEMPGRSSNSCRLRWQKLMDYKDPYSNFRWSHLARFLPVTLKRDYIFYHWRRYMMTNRRYDRLFVTDSVDHSVGSDSSGQNVQNNEGIISPTKIVGPMITYPILGQASQVITSGDVNVSGNKFMALATTSSNPSFVCAIPDLNLALDSDELNHPF